MKSRDSWPARNAARAVRVSMDMMKTALSAILALPVLLAPALAEHPNRPAQAVSGRADNPVRTDESCRPSSPRCLFSRRELRGRSWGLSGSNTCWQTSFNDPDAWVRTEIRIYPNYFAREYESIRLSCPVVRFSNPIPIMQFRFQGIRDLRDIHGIRGIRGIRSMPKNVRRRPFGKKMPLRVGLWSWAEDEGRKTLHLDVEHYQRTLSPQAWGLPLPTIREEEAAALIRKLHRADYVGWTMDNTGESSELAEIDERLREQIEIFMRRCGIDPGPAPRTPPAAPRITRHDSPNTAFPPQALRQKP